jgi:ribosomal protein L19E
MAHDKPVWSPPRRYSELKKAIGNEKVAELLAAGIIKEVPTDSKYASAVTMHQAYACKEGVGWHMD